MYVKDCFFTFEKSKVTPCCHLERQKHGKSYRKGPYQLSKALFNKVKKKNQKRRKEDRLRLVSIHFVTS